MGYKKKGFMGSLSLSFKKVLTLNQKGHIYMNKPVAERCMFL